MMKHSAKLGLNPSVGKTKIMKINCTSSRPIKINDRYLEEISSFVYLGSTVSVNGGTDEDIKVRINKARVVFNLLKKVWNSRVISGKTKLSIFNSNVKRFLSYGSEKQSYLSNNKLQAFVNKCLRGILKISWTDRVTNEDLWNQASQEAIQIQIREENGDGLVTSWKRPDKASSEMEFLR